MHRPDRRDAGIEVRVRPRVNLASPTVTVADRSAPSFASIEYVRVVESDRDADSQSSLLEELQKPHCAALPRWGNSGSGSQSHETSTEPEVSSRSMVAEVGDSE